MTLIIGSSLDNKIIIAADKRKSKVDTMGNIFVLNDETDKLLLVGSNLVRANSGFAEFPGLNLQRFIIDSAQSNQSFTEMAVELTPLLESQYREVNWLGVPESTRGNAISSFQIINGVASAEVVRFIWDQSSRSLEVKPESTSVPFTISQGDDTEIDTKKIGDARMISEGACIREIASQYLTLNNPLVGTNIDLVFLTCDGIDPRHLNTQCAFLVSHYNSGRDGAN